MNAQRTATVTHFGPLFLTALGGWVAFHLVNSGTLYIGPGVIVAALLAYGGTLAALRLQAAAHLRATDPTTYVAQHYPVTAKPRGIITMPSGEPRYEMDIAAGD
jgi:hypothetical protein